MSYNDSTQPGKTKEHFIVITKTDALELEDTIQKLGTHEMIRELEAAMQTGTPENMDLYRAIKKSVKEELLEISLRYQVLCGETAFVCKIKQNAAAPGQAQKVLIPSLISADYPVQKPRRKYKKNSRRVGGARGGGARNKAALGIPSLMDGAPPMSYNKRQAP